MFSHAASASATLEAEVIEATSTVRARTPLQHVSGAASSATTRSPFCVRSGGGGGGKGGGGDGIVCGEGGVNTRMWHARVAVPQQP